MQSLKKFEMVKIINRKKKLFFLVVSIVLLLFYCYIRKINTHVRCLLYQLFKQLVWLVAYQFDMRCKPIQIMEEIWWECQREFSPYFSLVSFVISEKLIQLAMTSIRLSKARRAFVLWKTMCKQKTKNITISLQS